MTEPREPIEPTEVYDSTRRSTSEKIRAAAQTVTGAGAGIKDFATSTVKDGSEKLRSTAESLPGDPLTKARTYTDRARTESENLRAKAREQAGRAAAPGGPVDWTENTINKVLGGVNGLITDAVQSGKVEKVFGFAQSTVSKGATQARKLLRK